MYGCRAVRTNARETLDQHMEGSHTLRHSTTSQPGGKGQQEEIKDATQ